MEKCKYCSCDLNKFIKALFEVTHASFGHRKYTGCVWCISNIRDEYNNNGL